MGTRLTALLSAILMVVLWVSPESVAYLCSMSGERGTTCCCGPDAEHAEQSEDEVERPSCCKVERTPANASPALAPALDDADYVATALACRQIDEHLGARAAPEFVPRFARGPPHALGPPPYLRNCRFLI